MFIIPWSEGAAANGASRLHIRTATERGCRRVDGAFREAVLPVAVQPLHGGGQQLFQDRLRLPGAEPDGGSSHADCGSAARGERDARRRGQLRRRRPDRGSASSRSRYAAAGKTGPLARRCCRRLQSRAVSLGYFGLCGETFKTNDQMKALARNAGFVVARSDDWRATRFEKQLLDRPRELTGARRTAPSLWWPQELAGTE